MGVQKETHQGLKLPLPYSALLHWQEGEILGPFSVFHRVYGLRKKSLASLILVISTLRKEGAMKDKGQDL